MLFLIQKIDEVDNKILDVSDAEISEIEKKYFTISD